jgi:hypothetical protein
LFRLNNIARWQFARAAMTAWIVAVAIALAGAGSASAASHTYCSGCTIWAGSLVQANYSYYIVLNYVHRLSGPGSGVAIGAIAKYVDNGSWGNWAISYGTEVTHGYNGARRAWGAAGNFGNGNYGFNAHVNY